MNQQSIRDAYAAARRKTLDLWATSPDAGPPASLPYDEAALAYAFGTLFEPPAALRPVIDALAALASVDSSIQPVPADSLHFTFLAVTPHRWPSVDGMPSPAELLRVATEHDVARPFEIGELMLLPGPNALLLAGVPAQATIDARGRLIDDLLATPAGAWLRERYGTLLPPVFWHTTLARTRTARCPQPLRELYGRHAAASFGELALPEPTLHAVSFDWSQRYAIAPRRAE